MSNNKYKVLFDLLKSHQWDEFIEIVKNDKTLDMNVRDDSNVFLLTYAVLYNQEDIVKLILTRNAKLDILDIDGRSILYIPIKYGYFNITNILLEKNKNTIGVSIVNVKDSKGNIPLHYAIHFQDIQIFKLLLKHGANIFFSDSKGNNSLHLAVHSKNYELCKLIINHNKMIVNTRQSNGENALHIACNFELKNIVELLLKNDINVNIQDYDQEFTPLHYAINTWNLDITTAILESGKANINLQDVYGNTILHYAVIGKRIDVVSMLLSYKQFPQNANLWNINGKIPLHFVFDIDEHVTDYIDILLQKSNLNIQDTEGNTCLHLLCKTGYWKTFEKRLVEKKMNIIVRNNKNQRPIDLVNKKDQPAFLDIVSASYVNILRTKNVDWAHEWENICKKTSLTKSDISSLKLKKLNPDIDPCLQIAREQITKLLESEPTCQLSTHPTKKSGTCINISEGESVSICSFTGTTLDILVGLLYLLQKHKNTCGLLPSNFHENKEVCEYYKSVGFTVNAGCEYLNFELSWVKNKLLMIEGFAELFATCSKNKQKKFIIVPLGIELEQASHSNYLIYDKTTQEVERFEPHGATIPPHYNYYPNLLDNALEAEFKKIDPDIKYISPQKYLPRVGFQLFDSMEKNKKKIGDPGGFCVLWSMWYVDMRITFDQIPRDKLVKKIIKQIRAKNISFKNMIRNYSGPIIKIRDKILEQANCDINDWINGEITSKQSSDILIVLNKYIAKLT